MSLAIDGNGLFTGNLSQITNLDVIIQIYGSAIFHIVHCAGKTVVLSAVFESLTRIYNNNRSVALVIIVIRKRRVGLYAHNLSRLICITDSADGACYKSTVCGHECTEYKCFTYLTSQITAVIRTQSRERILAAVGSDKCVCGFTIRCLYFNPVFIIRSLICTVGYNRVSVFFAGQIAVVAIYGKGRFGFLGTFVVFIEHRCSAFERMVCECLRGVPVIIVPSYVSSLEGRVCTCDIIIIFCDASEAVIPQINRLWKMHGISIGVFGECGVVTVKCHICVVCNRILTGRGFTFGLPDYIARFGNFNGVGILRIIH